MCNLYEFFSEIIGHAREVYSVAFSPDGRTPAIGVEGAETLEGYGRSTPARWNI